MLLKYTEVDLAEDKLVIGGDMINRGKESGKVIKSIRLLCEQYSYNVYAVIGNHEEMMGIVNEGIGFGSTVVVVIRLQTLKGPFQMKRICKPI